MENEFTKIVKTLKLRYPVKDITEKTSFNKGNISRYVTGKAPVSEPFLKKFCEVYGFDYKIIYETIFLVDNSSLVEEPETEYHRKVALQTLTESVTGLKQGDAPPAEADSLRAEVKQLRNELWLNSQKWDKRVQQLEKLVQTGFDALSEALAEHPAFVQKDDHKAKGARSHRK